MATIAFLGLGNMGIGMAGCLLAAGHSVRLYNRNAARAASLVRRGALSCATPREAASGADAIISMVTDDEASRSIWLGENGALQASPARAFAIECSTLSYDWVVELAARARDRELRYIDSPVTGLPEAAASGRLTLLVGAENGDLDAARGILDGLSERIVHFGPVGAGTVYKLLVNMLGAVQIASAAETLALAERAGLDIARVAEAISTGQAASPQVVRNCLRMIEGNHDTVVFTAQLRSKDVDYALRLANQLGLGSRFGTLAGTAFRELCDSGRAHVNESAIIEIARSRTTECEVPSVAVDSARACDDR